MNDHVARSRPNETVAPASGRLLSRRKNLLAPGRNCACRAHADRFALIIDAEHYFEVVADAIESATRSVFIVGWDIHGEARLREGNDRPGTLADLIDTTARRRPELEIRLLIWDFVFFYALERELFSALRHGWMTHPNIHFRFASDHPVGGSHHQKVVVIDDALAFVGGIDLTIARWDRPDHRAGIDARCLPNGSPYAPFHDIQVAVDGEAARYLGRLARERWQWATGEKLDEPSAPPAPRWPLKLDADIVDLEVGIARTAPAFAGRPARREIQELHVDMIAAAERVIYAESQYLTSATILEALGTRLREPDGPEVIIVTPARQVGRLESNTLGVLRGRWLAALRDHDRHGRLRVLYPVAAGDCEVAVNVHAKVLVIDDEVLRVGSANFTNRSMGLDTECDVVVEARGDPRIRSAIRSLRDRMVAHHLGIDEAIVGDDRSLLALIDEATESGERICRLELPRSEDQVEPLIADDVIDPFEPMDHALARSVLPSSLQREGSRRLPKVLWLVVLLLALAAVWAWTPLRGWVEPERLAQAALGLEGSFWGPLVFVVVMAAATLAMVPVTALIVAAALLFGPVIGAVAALCGSLIAAIAGYVLGRRLLHEKVQRLAGRRLHQLSRALGRRGILSVLAVRVVPVAPFTIVNLVAGSSHVRLRDFIIGTVLGMVPGLIGLSVAADRVAAAVRSPDQTTLVVAIAIVVVVAATLHFMRRWLQRVSERD